MDRADLIAGVALSLLGFLMIFIIIPLGTEEGTYFGLSPTFFPTVLTSFATAGALGLTAQALTRIYRRAPARRVPISGLNLVMFLVATGITLGGVLLIDRLGFLIGGPTLIAALMIFLGERSPLHIVLTATLPVGVVYLLAIYVLRTPLP
jgi:Tripartite tricarboxylate transporter TctB family